MGRAPRLGAGAAGGGGALLIAAGTREGRVLVWDARAGGRSGSSGALFECLGHSDQVDHLEFVPGALAASDASSASLLLLSAGRDWTARAWGLEAAAAECQGVMVGHGGAITALSVRRGCWCGGGGGSSSGGRDGLLQLVTGCEDGTVAVWRPSGELLAMREAHAAAVRAVAVLPAGGAKDGSGLVTAAGDMSVAVLDCCHCSPAHPLQQQHPKACCTPLAGLRRLEGIPRRARVAPGAAAFDEAAGLIVMGGSDGSVVAAAPAVR